MFGNPRAVLEIGNAEGRDAEGQHAAEGQVNKQATQTLNQFLDAFYNPKELRRRALAIEGRFEFRELPPSAGLPATFSRGLPADVVATWEGAWQVVLDEGGPVPTGGNVEEPPPAAAASSGRSAARPAPRVRLNGALGALRFSRPVVLRRLLVRPPAHAATGRHRLIVRARKGGKEAWRQAYDFDADAGPEPRLVCAVGDVVTARWAGDGRRALAVLLALHNASATVRWLDDDHTHRLVPWRHLQTADGAPCAGASRAVQAGPIGSWSNLRRLHPLRSGLRSGGPPPLWRDLARRIKAADEVSFSVPFGAEGWLLADVSVAAVRWPAKEGAADSTGGADTEKEPGDASAHVVQVFPGPRAVIVEASRAAVLYHADDMLERGLRLRAGLGAGQDAGYAASDPTDVSGEPDGAGDTSAQLLLHHGRSVEGLNQFLRALTEQSARLPPHVRPDQLLVDLERLVLALDPARSEDSPPKKYHHFEAFFAYHWDWLTPVDALEVAFGRWRTDPATVREAEGIFFEGQFWLGSYFCTQGPTSMSLNVTRVEQDADGQVWIQADLTFTIDAKDQPVRGQYVVAGRAGSEGRALSLEPVPGSWRDQPNNFVMVGLQGVVSRPSPGAARFAGSVPIFGCDSFELAAEPAEAGEVDAKPEEQRGMAQAWLGPITRLRRALEENRQRWRLELQRLIGEKGGAKKVNTVQAGIRSLDAQQIAEAFRTGQLTVEMTSGEEIIVRIGR